MRLFREALSVAREKELHDGRLAEKHLADLRASGISDETIGRAGLATVSAEEAEDYLGYSPGSACLVFEYPGPEPYYRLKPARPLTGPDGTRRKYLAAKESGNRLYLPTGFISPEDITDTDVALIITEGEKKALRACQEGHKAAAIPGAWGWRTSSDDGTGATQLLEELSAIQWTGRNVYICLDSDAATNPEVGRAQDALAKELRQRGTRVLIVRLPGSTGEKVGLDDYFVQHGVDEFEELLHQASPPASSYFHGLTFIPLKLAKELTNRERYIYPIAPESGAGRLYVYRHGVYRPTGTVEIDAQQLLGEETRTARISEAVEALKREVAIPSEELNHETMLMNVKNGMLDPFTGELHPHDPSYLSTIQHPVSWDPTATSEELDAFLTQVCADWADSICELAGYLLLPINLMKKLFIWHGDTDTGKTTLMNLFKGTVGQAHYAQVPLGALGNPARRFVLAELEDKLVDFADDLPGVHIDDPSILKIMTGGMQYIRIERKYEEPYEVRNFCRIVCAANQLPSCSEKGDAWYGRLAIFPFSYRLGKKEKDPRLRERFETDAGLRRAMLVKAVEGIKRLEARDWDLEGSSDELAAYKEWNDPVMSFIAECCTIKPEERVKRTDLWAAYESYCRGHGLPVLASARRFYDRIRSDPRFSEKTVSGAIHFAGLALEGGRP